MVDKGVITTADTRGETARFAAVFLAVAPAMFLGALDQTIVATALPVIAKNLGSFADIAWVVTAYLLAATVAAPIYGRLGDAIGRKVAMLGALALFVAGSLSCALAPTFTALVVARAVQGLGGGGLMTLAQAMIGQAVSPRERGRFQGWFGAIFALSSTLGPLLGGLLSEHLGWRWIFWINVPLGLGAAFAAWHGEKDTETGRFVPDLLGTAIFVAATLSLLLALNLGPDSGWTSALVVTLFCASVIGFGALLPVERRVAAPLLSPGLLAQPVVWRSALCVSLFAAALFGAVVQMPLLLHLAFGVGPAVSGLMLIPFTLAQVVVSTWAGQRISVTGLPRGPLIAGLVLATCGFIALATTLQFGPIAIVGTSILFGLGLGTTSPVAQTLAQWAGGKARLGVVTATLTFSRAVGGVIGTAISSAILMAAMNHYASGSATPFASLLDDLAGGGPNLSAAVVMSAFRWVFAGVALLTVAAAGVACTIPPVNLADPEPGASDPDA